VVASNIESFLGRGLVLRKMLHHLDLISSATSAQASAAAFHLMNILDSSDIERGGWVRIVYPLLAQAINSAGSDQEARDYIDSFLDLYGLLNTTYVLARERTDTVDEELRRKVRFASQGVREAVLRVCELDLSVDVKEADPDALTILHFLFYLDRDLIREMSLFARDLISTRRSKPYELAGRFVQIRLWRDGSTEHEDYLNYFAQVIPEDDWNAELMPSYSREDVKDGDISLANKIRLAVVLINKRLSNSEELGS
jgi:hypothetical protein